MTHEVFKSSDENVQKFVFESEPNSSFSPIAVESVLYRYGSFKKRTVICCSTQCGCPVGCSFCGTGRHFVRNLSAAEIVEQVRTIVDQYLDCDFRDIEKFQIMFMSMGEPMLNWERVRIAILELNSLYPNADLLISTSAPENMFYHLQSLIILSRSVSRLGLQFSVHESTDEARMKLIPTSTSTLRQIACMGEMWAAYTGRKPFFNYCVHEGNGTYRDSFRLANIFNPRVWECTLSVICSKDESVQASIRSQLALIRRFSGIMEGNGFSLRVFNPAGQDDIGGGCGQLWYFQQWRKAQEDGNV